MSIITEQNILGEPSMAQAQRPGSDQTAASYAFSTKNARANTEEYLAGSLGGGAGFGWTRPKSYAPTVDMIETVGDVPTPANGPASKPVLDDDTSYGLKGDTPLTENATMTTPLSQVAEVIAQEEPANQPLLPANLKNASAVKSEVIKEMNEQGPIASGGDFVGYESTNQYHINTVTEEITPPAPIEDTGIKAIMPAIAEASVAQEASNLGSDDPVGNIGNTKTIPPAVPANGPPPAKKKIEKVVKSSAVKNVGVNANGPPAKTQTTQKSRSKPYTNPYAAAAAAQVAVKKTSAPISPYAAAAAAQNSVGNTLDLSLKAPTNPYAAAAAAQNKKRATGSRYGYGSGRA